MRAPRAGDASRGPWLAHRTGLHGRHPPPSRAARVGRHDRRRQRSLPPLFGDAARSARRARRLAICPVLRRCGWRCVGLGLRDLRLRGRVRLALVRTRAADCAPLCARLAPRRRRARRRAATPARPRRLDAAFAPLQAEAACTPGGQGPRRRLPGLRADRGRPLLAPAPRADERLRGQRNPRPAGPSACGTGGRRAAAADAARRGILRDGLAAQPLV